MPLALHPDLRRRLHARIDFYRELGIHDFYRRPLSAATAETDRKEEKEDALMEPFDPPPAKTGDDSPAGNPLRVLAPAEALAAIRAELGDCTRCRLSRGRHNLVFGVGDPHAELMFIGEGPGADEDAQGEPFVGRAGKLLDNMIAAMGLARQQVYIANVVKCRPPGNRQPERDECDTCSPFLLRQIEAIRPKIIVALGATAARTLLGIHDSMNKLRGLLYDFRGTKLAVTYHPAFLLRDPRQKKEAWKDLQQVMRFLGLPNPPRSPQTE